MNKVIGSVLIIIGIVVYLFFRNYEGDLIPLPTLWLIVGILIAILGLKLMFGKTKDEIKKEDEIQGIISELKMNGNILHVNLRECEIVSNHYFKEEPKSSIPRVQGFDAIYDSENSVKNIEINQSRIVFRDKNSGKEFISPIIAIDDVSLRFLIENKGDTNIYVDKLDYNKFYFDLEFLN